MIKVVLDGQIRGSDCKSHCLACAYLPVRCDAYIQKAQ